MAGQPNSGKKGLTAKQRLFIAAYLANGFNATRAAQEAGYKGNDNTLHSIGSENLRKPAIAEAIRARVAELDKQFESRIMGRYEVLAGLTEIARGDMGDIDISSPEALLRAKEAGKSKLIKKIKETTYLNAKDDSETHTFELELYSAHDALRDLGKHYALFTDKVEIADWRAEVEAAGLSPDEVLKAFERAYEKAAAQEAKQK